MILQVNHDSEAAIFSEDLLAVREVYARSSPGDGVAEVEFEFRRFMCVVLYEHESVAVIDRRVDAFWHCFMLFSRKYREFCDRAFGFFVDHQPRTAFVEVPAASVPRFVRAFEMRFGPLPNFWLQALAVGTPQEIRAGEEPRELLGDWSGWPGRE